MTTQAKLKTLTKSLIIAGVIGAVSLPVAAKRYNDHKNSAYGYAKVVDVSPLVETYQVNHPVEKCWDERVSVQQYDRGHRSRSATPLIAGAIIGGLVGNRVGSSAGGNGRDVATVAGAVLGGSIGRDFKLRNKRNYDRKYTRGHGTSYKTVQHCELQDSYVTKEKVVGYNVAYKYQGNVFHTQLDQHPGDKIKVKVTVDPVSY